jgi:hypothetical protein
LLATISLVVMTLSSVNTLVSRSDYQLQLVRSQPPTIPAFLVHDILAAACAHLVINALLGLAGAGLAIIGSRAVRTVRPWVRAS